MFKFFRKIRYKLMSENRTSKYFKYAIGEILLVVIGILIALQINNWNESRKAGINQKNLLSNLRIDFDARLQELKEMQKAKAESLNTIAQLNGFIASRNGTPEDSVMDYHLSRTVNGFKFNEDFKMLDVVFNTGLINEIENETLKRKLIEWPQELEEMLEEQRMHNQLIDTRLVPYYSRYVSIRDIYEKFDFRKYNLPKTTETTLDKNYAALLKDPLFENFLAESEMLMRVSSVDIQTLINSAEEIMVLIENEL